MSITHADSFVNPLDRKISYDKIERMAINSEKAHWGLEPQWTDISKDPIEQSCALARAENWYHHMASEDDRRRWIFEFMKSHKFTDAQIKSYGRTGRVSVDADEVAPNEPGCNLGALARLVTLGAPVPEVRKERLLRGVRYLVAKGLTTEDERWHTCWSFNIYQARVQNQSTANALATGGPTTTITLTGFSTWGQSITGDMFVKGAGVPANTFTVRSPTSGTVELTNAV
ncbi:MAG: hypothetical protein EBU08_13625, partial [Micrococcales bacterium]|nr:hypothetical protein [Micrococcales bacterium]